MSRVKRGLGHLKRRKYILKRVKGFEAGRKNLIKLAKTAELKAGAHAYRDRRVKKRTMRALWNIRVNAGAREQGVSYSVLMGGLKKRDIRLNRKALAALAADEPAIFAAVVAEGKKAI